MLISGAQQRDQARPNNRPNDRRNPSDRQRPTPPPSGNPSNQRQGDAKAPNQLYQDMDDTMDPKGNTIAATHSNHTMTQQQIDSKQFRGKPPMDIPSPCKGPNRMIASMNQTPVRPRVSDMCPACHQTFPHVEYHTVHMANCPASFCVLCGLWGHSKHACLHMHCETCHQKGHYKGICSMY